jgi:hypothetical protein
MKISTAFIGVLLVMAAVILAIPISGAARAVNVPIIP